MRAEGHEERVAGLERAAGEIAQRHGGSVRVLDDDAAALIWRARGEAWRPRGAGVVRGTWTIPRGGLAAALTMLPQLLPASDLAEHRIGGHAGDGVLHVVLQPRDEHEQQAFVPAAGRCIIALRAAAAALGGSWRTELAPDEVWSRAGADPAAARQRPLRPLPRCRRPRGHLQPDLLMSQRAYREGATAGYSPGLLPSPGKGTHLDLTGAAGRCIIRTDVLLMHKTGG